MGAKKVLRRKKIVQFVGLLLLLVLLPLGSWFYLKTGLDYRAQAFKELKDIAPLPAFELQNYNDSTARAAQFEDQLVVGHFFNEPHKELYAQQLSKLYEQFDDRQDIYFLSFQPGASVAQQAEAAQFLLNHKLEDEEQVFFLGGSERRIKQLSQDIKLPLEEQSMELSDNSLLFFADSAMVRGFYDMREEAAMKRLIKHLTLNLHPTEEADIIYDPETEK